MRVTALLPLFLLPCSAASANEPQEFKQSAVSYAIRLNGEPVHGSGIVATNVLSRNQWGQSVAALRVDCGAAGPSLSSVHLFDGWIVTSQLMGDQVNLHVAQYKVIPVDEKRAIGKRGQCTSSAPSQVTIYDRTVTIPADTRGGSVDTDLGGGYTLHVSANPI